MKRFSTLAGLACVSAAAAAQSVSLYGVVDVGLRHVRNGDATVTSVASNGNNTSRVGLKGLEDLGDGDPKPVTSDNPFFRRWCETALTEDGDVTSRLFSIRAAGLLQDLQADDAAACLSGLLIGGEIASASRRHGAGAEPVVLVASGALAALYQVALGLAGLKVRTVDADEAVRAGLVEAARENGMIARTGAAR